MSNYKVYKDLRKLGYINHLRQLRMYLFRESTNNDENQIVTGALPTMSRYREQLQVSIVFPSNKSSSFLDAKVPKVYPSLKSFSLILTEA